MLACERAVIILFLRTVVVGKIPSSAGMMLIVLFFFHDYKQLPDHLGSASLSQVFKGI